jgi:hypothetical protein
MQKNGGSRQLELWEKPKTNRGRSKTLKVTTLSQGNGEYVPWIRVAGKWLREFGFEFGDEVVLTAIWGQISIIRKEGKRDEG